MLVIESQNAMARSRGDFRLFLETVAPRCRLMSLNAAEQLVFDYVQSHPEERHFWVAKVQSTLRHSNDETVAATRLATDLWHYFEERSAVASPFRELASQQGVRRTSMRNLAEYMLRLWTEPRPKKPRAREDFIP